MKIAARLVPSGMRADLAILAALVMLAAACFASLAMIVPLG
jgi:hypothetical protein